MDLVTAAQTGRIELLTVLRDQIARQIQDGVPARDMASLSKRLVDISIELDALAAEKEGDDIDEAASTPDDSSFAPTGGAQARTT